MVTIKGPMKFNRFNASEFIKDKLQGVKLKLPFEAKVWESTRVPEGVDLSGIEFASDNVKDIPVVVESSSDKIESSCDDGEVPPSREYFEAMDFKDLKKLAKENYKVTGRSKDGIIDDIMKAIETGYSELE